MLVSSSTYTLAANRASQSLFRVGITGGGLTARRNGRNESIWGQEGAAGGWGARRECGMECQLKPLMQRRTMNLLGIYVARYVLKYCKYVSVLVGKKG